METHDNEFPIASMARILKVSRSNYYKYVKRCKEELLKYDSEILNLLKHAWRKSKKTYGVVRLLKVLKEVDSSYGARRLRKMMRILEIKGKQEKKFRVVTTDSKHNESVAEDLVKRRFDVKKKNQVWVSDVTCIKSSTGWLYLCVILDLFSRRVVGWSLSEKNDSELVISAFEKATFKRNPDKGLIFHSDRGSNYCSKEFQEILENNYVLRSNSRKGNCWDNAVSESFFSSLKRELEYNIFYDIEDAKTILFEHLEIFYNRQRMHSKLEYKSPCEFEELAA